jgi:ABC-2 type transport system permease protein
MLAGFLSSGPVPAETVDFMSTTSLAAIPSASAPPPTSQALLLQWLRWRQVRNTLRVVVKQSTLRVLTVVLCSAFIWGSLFAMSFAGFGQLRSQEQIPLDGRIMGLLFDMMFLTLTVLLVFSTGIILYSSLFASPETAFLLSGPLAADHIFAHKFQAAVGFSSWAFVLLGSPILLAYGLQVNGGAPWYFYALMPLYFLGFVLLPGSLGGLLCLLLVNFFPQRRRSVLVGAVAVLVMATAAWAYARLVPNVQRAGLSQDWLQQLLGEFSLFRGPLMPAGWISQGLQAAALGEAGEAVYFLAVIWGNGLFLYVATAWVARRLYRRGYNRLAAGGTPRKRYGTSWMDRLLGAVLAFLDPQTRLLTVKDFRTFRRDPAQWAQVLIFVGLALLYFSSMRRFYEQDFRGPYQNGISLINLVAVAFLMCAYTGRFIFPMLSLEGRKFWILGLLPLRRDRLVWGKFAFSVTGCLFFSEMLIIISDVMLSLPWFLVALHALTIGVLSVAFSGLSVGLGACLPNFSENDPSKIAVGFGGTLNLVAGLVLLLVVVGLMVMPCHLVMAGRQERGLAVDGAEVGIVLGALVGVAVGAAATVIPLRAGAWALRRMEF